MRILGLTLLASSLVLANSLVVKKGDVEISLNNLPKKMKKGEELSLDYGTSVCFMEGKGRVVVNKRIQLKKPGKCYLVPVPEGFSIKKYAKKLENAITVTMIDSSEDVRHGVSTKAVVNLDDGKDIVLPKNDKELIVYSNKFGPHPVTINLKDEKGNILFSVENEENDITFFRVAASSVKTNYRIEILDGFGSTLVDKRIIKE